MHNLEGNGMKWGHTLMIVVVCLVTIWASNNIALVKNLVG